MDLENLHTAVQKQKKNFPRIRNTNKTNIQHMSVSKK